MNVRLPLLALAFTSTLVGAHAAEAGHVRVHFGGGAHWGGGGGSAHWSGGVHVGGSVHYGYSRPAWRPQHWGVGGSIYVGPTYTYYPRPYYTYYPQYVPSYYESASYYPVAPVAAPGLVAVARAPLPRLGVGLFGGGSAVAAPDGGSAYGSDDVGLLGRIRLTEGLLLEGEIGKMSYDQGGYDNVRVDRRLGASLVYEIGAYNRWAPYVLGGIGVQQAQTAGTYETNQDYAELGIGLRWAVSRQFHLAFDIRAGSRATVSDNTSTMPAGTVARTITPPSASSGQSEDYTRGRLSAMLYF